MKKKSLAKLKNCISIQDLSLMLGVKASTISFLAYAMSDDERYHCFSISKKYGGNRTILSPEPRLKVLQKRLATILQDCYDEISRNIIKDHLSHGFARGRSIYSNASIHRNKRFVLNIDLSDFFDSFNFGRVRGFFLRNNHFKLHPDIATTIAQIACYENRLPQGSPLSPVITNLIGHILDIRLSKLAKDCQCLYSRYADDLTFSTNIKVFPARLAIQPCFADDWRVGTVLEQEIRNSGFQVNHSKTRLQYKDSRQVVTGLVVNRKVNTPKELRYAARAMVNSLTKTGGFYTQTKRQGYKVRYKGKISYLQGLLSYIEWTRIQSGERGYHKSSPECSSTKLFRNFLVFKEFFHAEKPTILCEGKTDYVYLEEAIKSLHPRYPGLVSKVNDSYDYKVRFFRYTDFTRRILGLSGGSGNLKNFLTLYEREIRSFNPSLKRSPTILVIDNDTGAKQTLSTINQNKAEKVENTSPFIHFVGNLYVVLTPRLNGEDSNIECFFDPHTLNTVLSGKTFSRENSIDTAKHYSKEVFAKKVVRSKSKTIDFSRFQQVFDRIQAVIDRSHKVNLVSQLDTKNQSTLSKSFDWKYIEVPKVQVF